MRHLKTGCNSAKLARSNDSNLQNFLNVTRIRPGDLVEDDSEEEVEHDADEAPTWQVGEDNLQQALETQAPCHAKL